jgi:molybdopterin synthase sulfur carrier subunit
MKVPVKYYGLIAEALQKNDDIIEFSGNTAQELLDVLYVKYPILKTKDFQIAQHNHLLLEDEIIDETQLALLPPFAGG